MVVSSLVLMWKATFFGILFFSLVFFFFFQAEDGIRDLTVTGVQTCALPISGHPGCLHGCARDRLLRELASRDVRAALLRDREPRRVGGLRRPDVGPHRLEIGRASCRERV